jgi:hypothetical protein
MISANGITFVMLLIILVVKIRYRTHSDTSKDNHNEQRNQKSTSP